MVKATTNSSSSSNSRFLYTNIVKSNVVIGKRVSKLVQPTNIKSETKEEKIAREQAKKAKLEKEKELNRERARINKQIREENKAKNTKPKKQKEWVGPIIPFRYDPCKIAMAQMESDIGRKLTVQEKKRIRDEYRL
jgi:hypothetical protein